MTTPKINYFKVLKITVPIIAISLIVFIVYLYYDVPKHISHNTRGPVSETQVIQQELQKDSKTMDNFIQLMTLIGVILTALIGYASLNISQFKKDFKFEIGDVKKQIARLLDKDDKLMVLEKLKEIEKEAIQYVEGYEITSLIEGITKRTISFIEIAMNVTHKLDYDSFDLCIKKLEVRNEEGRKQTQTLGFNATLIREIELIRMKSTEFFVEELRELHEEDIFNSKYSRVGEISAQYLRMFLRGVVKQYNKHENS